MSFRSFSNAISLIVIGLIILLSQASSPITNMLLTTDSTLLLMIALAFGGLLIFNNYRPARIWQARVLTSMLGVVFLTIFGMYVTGVYEGYLVNLDIVFLLEGGILLLVSGLDTKHLPDAEQSSGLARRIPVKIPVIRLSYDIPVGSASTKSKAGRLNHA